MLWFWFLKSRVVVRNDFICVSTKSIFYWSGCQMPKAMVNAEWHPEEIVLLGQGQIIVKRIQGLCTITCTIHAHAQTFPCTPNSPHNTSLNSLSI